MLKKAIFLSKIVSPSIATKIALILTALVLGGMALLSLVILGNQSSILSQQADAYAAALGDQLTIAAVEPLLADDVEAMHQLIRNLAQNEGIEGIAIFSDEEQSRVAIGDIPSNTSAWTPYGKALLWQTDKNGVFQLSSYKNKITYRDLTVGYAVLTFDRSFMSAAYRDTLKTISFITALMLVLGTMVATALGRRLSQPIKQLVDGTQEISEGNYTFRFQDCRRDELGQLMGALNTMTEGLEKKEQVEQTFSRYVSPKVASRLMTDLKTNRLGGSHVEATVLYADIVGFSRLSEELDPETINTLLNDYFTVIDEVAGHHKGHIDKYIGDCAMILFGAPLPDENHSLHGVRCGLEIQRVIKEYNKVRSSQGQIVVDFSVAVNSGTMLAGNMGSERRMEYTVIGDAVNLAARLCSIATSGQVLVAKELHDALQLHLLYQTESQGVVKLRGKSEPVEVWQVGQPVADAAAFALTETQGPATIH